jgi:hypothetical protein
LEQLAHKDQQAVLAQLDQLVQVLQVQLDQLVQLVRQELQVPQEA